MNTLVVLGNLLLIGWISIKSFTHFDRGDREPNGMKLIRLLTPIGVLANIYHFIVYPKNISPIILAMAVLLIFGSSMIFFYALRASKSTRLPVAYSFDPQKRLITYGIYSRIRHPFYASYIMYWLSWLFLNPESLPVVLIDMVLIGVYLVAIEREEKFLEKNFGITFRKYKSHTFRIIPYIF